MAVYVWGTTGVTNPAAVRFRLAEEVVGDDLNLEMMVDDVWAGIRLVGFLVIVLWTATGSLGSFIWHGSNSLDFYCVFFLLQINRFGRTNGSLVSGMGLVPLYLGGFVAVVAIVESWMS